MPGTASFGEQEYSLHDQGRSHSVPTQKEVMPLLISSDRRPAVAITPCRNDLEHGGNERAAIRLAREGVGTFVADALALPAISRPRCSYGSL